MNKKRIGRSVILCAIILIGLLTATKAEADSPSAFTQDMQANIQKKIDLIKDKVKEEVTFERKKKITEKQTVMKKEQAMREEKMKQQKKMKLKETAESEQNVQDKMQRKDNEQARSKSNTQNKPVKENKQESQNTKNQTDVNSGASQRGKEIGEKNKEYGKQLSDPNLTNEERQKIIEEKKKYNQSH